MTINVKKSINIIIFVMIFAFRSFTDAIYISNGIENNFLINIKYILLLLGIIYDFLNLKANKKIMRKEFINICLCILFLFGISIFWSILNNRLYFSALIGSIFKMFIPICYVYLFINSVDDDDIYKAMSLSLIFSFIGYVMEIGFSNFNLANFKLLNFLNSYSPFESSFSAGASIAFCIYFFYYRENKFLTFIGFLFSILTFKRLSIVFSIFMFFLPHFINVNKKISNKVHMKLAVIFIFLTIGYYYIISPNFNSIFIKFFGVNQDTFTMGRSAFLNSLLLSNYKTSGLGSIVIFWGKDIEMDLIRIYLETSIFGLCVFCFGYWSACGTKRYTLYYMIFIFFNMLTSHSLGNPFNWIITYVTIGSISYVKQENFKYLGRSAKNENRNFNYN